MTIDGKATRDAKNAQRIRNGCAGHGFVLAVWSRWQKPESWQDGVDGQSGSWGRTGGEARARGAVWMHISKRNAKKQTTVSKKENEQVQMKTNRCFYKNKNTRTQGAKSNTEKQQQHKTKGRTKTIIWISSERKKNGTKTIQIRAKTSKWHRQESAKKKQKVSRDGCSDQRESWGGM